MNREQAKELIRDTFESPFDKDRFIKFIVNLLNLKQEDLQNTRKGPWQGIFIPEAFKNYISKYERIARYVTEDDTIDILIVHLKRQTSIERARSTQRNFVAGYLKGNYGSDTSKDASLVAFVSPDENDWRFSLVTMDYEIVQTKSGNWKGQEKFSQAKRWSFLVGKNEKSHTAQTQLLPILEDDEHNPTLKQLEEAFNIEPVTKEFFEKYRELLIRTVDALDKIVERDARIKKDFEDEGVHTVDFAKKLLGQIVFLYFLQKKGWFGVKRDADWGTGPKDFLRRLFNKEYGNYENFFNDILEPLFYEALNRERDDNFYSRFNCKIPFLNGGLFEPIGGYDWEKTDIILPDELFSNTRRTPEGDIGDGILDVFDRFNFTVKEDEPLEKEVAIDPELLGKLYEKFNAIKPNNFYEYKKALASGKKSLEKQFNKKFGVYYTPREIVHYMCQQSLIYYLEQELQGEVSKEDIEKLIKYGEQFTENEATALIKEQKIEECKQKNSEYIKKLRLPESIRKNARLIDDKLRDIKICDPAVGSGAFPVGMMHEIVKTRNVLSTFINESGRTTYNFKRECIENSLYGVDIDAGACEIAKLRLWLSLIVDEEDIKQIKPLPNLDYKIMQGNSLISEFLGVNLDVDKKAQSKGDIFEDKTDSLIKQLQEKKNKFLNEPERNKKEQLRKEIEDLIIMIFEEKIRKQKFDYFVQLKNIEQLASMLPDKEQQNKYLTEEKAKLYKRTGFNLEQIEKQLKEYTSGKRTRPFFPWKLYFAEVFQEKGGFDVVIANPPYVKEYTNRKAFDGLRESPYYQGKMDIWYLFACKGIDLLKDNSGILTFIAQNNWVTSYGASKLRNKVIKDTSILQMLDFGEHKIFENAGIQTMIMVFKKDSETDNYKFDYRRLTSNNECFQDVLDLLNKKQNPNIEYLTPVITRSKYLGATLTFCSSAIGEILDKMSKRSNFKLHENEIAQGIVCPQDRVIKSTQKILGNQFNIGDGIFVLSNEEKVSIPFTKKELKLIKPYYTTKELGRYYANKNNSEWIIYTDSRFKYPENIKPYPNIKKHLDKFQKVITSDNKPYGLHRARDEKFFKGEKIITVRKCTKPAFTYTNFECYVSAAFYVIKTEKINLKYLTGLLNSKLIAFWLKHKGKMQGNNYQIDKEPLLALSIIKPLEEKQKKIIDLVNQILSFTQSEDYLENPQKQARVKEYERQIDQLVYKLYGLTEEEIKIVEDFEKKTNQKK